MNRLSIIILCIVLNISSHAQEPIPWGDWQSWGEQTDGTYRNPVIPADYSDLDCICASTASMNGANKATLTLTTSTTTVLSGTLPT